MTAIPDKAAQIAWRRTLLADKARLDFLMKARGLDLETIKGARLGWDGERYTIPIRTPDGRLPNVRRYNPTAEPKVLSIAGHGTPRLYAPVEAPTDAAPVLVLEGELDCLKASQELTEWWSVTGTGGAGKPPPVEDLEALRGRDVVIAYDCDAAGRKGAVKLAEALDGIASLVRVAELGLADGEDVTDWFVTYGRDAAALCALLQGAPHYIAGTLRERRSPQDLLHVAVSKVEELGSRNGAGFWLACQLRDERYSIAEAEPVILKFAGLVRDGKAEPFPDGEVMASLRSAYADPPREPVGSAAERKAGGLFRLIGPASLAEPVAPMEWLIEGLWPRGSYGPWGGAKKSLKTYSASIAAIAVAAGVHAFNNTAWRVPSPRPVIYYGGEGGEAMHKRRLQRIAREVYGMDLADLPFYLVTGIGPFNSPEFTEALERNLADVEKVHGPVGLVVLDSLYNYHPAGVEVSNLYERGRMLAGLSALLVERGIALWVVDHFNKNGNGIDLDRLAQAGMAAWADSWALFEHATEPDVAAGTFTLSMGVGSRQWGGDEYTVRIDIGPFDPAAREHLTPLKVETSRGIAHRRAGRAGQAADLTAAILTYVEEHPDQTYTKIREAVTAELGVGDKKVKSEFDKLESGLLLVSARVKVQERGREVTRQVWRLGDGKVRLNRSRADSEPTGARSEVKS